MATEWHKTSTSFRWWHLSAEQDHPPACAKLAKYFRANGDTEEADKWGRRASRKTAAWAKYRSDHGESLEQVEADVARLGVSEQASLSGKGGGDLLHRCGACGKTAAPKKCDACRLQWYCDEGAARLQLRLLLPTFPWHLVRILF